MKELTVSELFSGYKDIILPQEISELSCYDLTFSASNVQNNSIFFISEKTKKADCVFNCATLNSIPIAIVLSKTQRIANAKCPLIRVESPRTALAYAFSNMYGIDYEKHKIIAVTGTNGKTTTATIIYEILRNCGFNVGFIGTGKIVSNSRVISSDTYSMTTPDPSVLYPAIAKMSSDKCEYIVMEVSSHAIALGKIAPIKFEYAIFTNLGNDHLDFHKSKEEYFNTKLSLFRSTKTGLFNLDDEYTKKAAELSYCNSTTFGIINQGDAYATEINMELSGSSFYYRQPSLIFKVHTSLPGAFNVYNVIAALKCVIDLGVAPCIAKKALLKIDKIDGRMEIIDNRLTVVIDYAHTPEAFYNCLKTLNHSLKHRQKLIVVFGCGGDRDPAKRPIFGKYAEMYADSVIITEDNSRNEEFDSIVKDITSEMIDTKYRIIQCRETAIRYAIGIANSGDVVAIVGKGHERYKIIKNEYLPFDERKIIESAFAEMDDSNESRT